MRAYHIALFIFLLNFSFTTVSQLTDTDGNNIFFGAAVYSKLNQSEYDRAFVNDTANDIRAFSDSGGANVFDAVKFIWEGFTWFVNLFIMSTVGIPLLLMEEPFNFPDFLCYWLLAGMVITYVGAIIMFIAGRETED